MAFQVTSAAVQELIAAAARSDAAGMALRIAAQPASGGLEFGMGFDDTAPDDEVLEFGGLTVLLGAASRSWLAATVLDYAEVEPGRPDFIFFEQPQAAAPGCATSRCGGGSGGGCSGCGG